MSFLKKIWKPLAAVGSVAAAPFTGGMSLIGLGALGSSMLGGKKDGTPGTDPRSQAEQLQLQSGQRLLSTTEELQPQARSFMDLAGRSLNPVVDYWSRILSGSRGDMTSLLAPELNRISEGYNTARGTLNTLSPRGGGTSAMMAELPFQQARDVSTLFQTARPRAAAGLLEAGGTAGAIGEGSYRSILGGLSGAGMAGSNILDAMLQRRAQNFGIGTEIGKAIPAILQALGIGKG